MREAINVAAMSHRRRHGLLGFAVLALATLVLPGQLVAESGVSADPIRRTLVFRGAEREYFVYLPAGFNRDTKYWPIVVVGGVSGLNFLSTGIAQRVAESGFEAIVISPTTLMPSVFRRWAKGSSFRMSGEMFGRSIRSNPRCYSRATREAVSSHIDLH